MRLAPHSGMITILSATGISSFNILPQVYVQMCLGAVSLLTVQFGFPRSKEEKLGVTPSGGTQAAEAADRAEDGLVCKQVNDRSRLNRGLSFFCIYVNA